MMPKYKDLETWPEIKARHERELTELIKVAVARTNGNRTQAAEDLLTSRQQLQSWIRNHGISDQIQPSSLGRGKAR